MGTKNKFDSIKVPIVRKKQRYGILRTRREVSDKEWVRRPKHLSELDDEYFGDDLDVPEQEG